MPAARALVLLLLLGACAVKGYDLGWRSDDRLAGLLGAPLDGIAPCRSEPGVPPRRTPCQVLLSALEAELRALSPRSNAPEALGAECRVDKCSYANAYERRDVGLAAILPVYRKIPLRMVRIRFERGADGGWSVTGLSVLDQAPPNYGPVRIGG